MPHKPGNTALTKHRARLAREGKVRVEIQVSKEDATLMREVAKALNDPDRASETRARLLGTTKYAGMDFKELLRSFPSFEGFDLDRGGQRDRDVEL